MLIKEIFLQSIGPFLKSRRFQFEEGTNVILGPNGVGKTTLYIAIQSLFNSEVFFKNKDLLKPWIPQDDPARIGIIFERNERVFKLIKDLEKNSSALFERINNKFTGIAKGTEIEDFFVDDLDFPLGNDFISSSFIADTFTISPIINKNNSEFSNDPWSDSTDQYDDFAGEERKNPEERLEELNNELQTAEKIEEKEFKLEGLEKKLFEIKEQLGEIEELQSNINKVTGFLQKNSELQNFPTDFESKIKNLKDSEREIDIIEEELTIEEENFTEEMTELKNYKKYHKDPIFDIIVLITLSGFILPFVTTFIPGWAVFFGLGGLATSIYWVILKYPAKEKNIKNIELEHQKSLQPKRNKLAAIKNELDTINDITGSLGIKDTNELIILIKRFYSAINKKNEMEELLKYKKDELDFDSLDKQREELTRDIENTKEELENIGRPTMDIVTLKQEIKKLEKSLGRTQVSEDIYQQNEESYSDGFGFNNEKENNTPPEYKKLLENGLKLSRHPESTFIGYVRDNFEKYLMFLSNKRFVKQQIDENFDISCSFRATDKEVTWETLSQGDLNTIYFALFFAVEDILATTRNLPLILDNSFIYFDDKTFVQILKLIKKLSVKTQVVLLNRRELSSKIASKVIKLETVDELI